VLWLEAIHWGNIDLQCFHSALDSKTPHFRIPCAISGRWPRDDSIFSMHVQNPTSLFLGVQSFHLTGCQAGGYGQRSGSGDASSHSCNLILSQDVVQFLTQSALYFHQLGDSLQPQEECSNGVTLPFLWFLQSKWLGQRFQYLLGRFTGAGLPEYFPVMTNLLQISRFEPVRGFSMFPVLSHTVKIHDVLEAQQDFCEANPLAQQRVSKSGHENFNNHAPECFHLLTTPLHQLAIGLVESS